MSSLLELDDPWGLLVGEEEEGDFVPLVGEQFSIGRGKSNKVIIRIQCLTNILLSRC